ncbi:hypothetical protein SFRURICE_014869 [Spodoptera frugiperda]|nr:hypothetical protein SFRURICE_014869 [Spodoptera frugiperda]
MAPEIKYTKLFIDNEWVDAKSGKTFETYNPHDESVIAREDVDLAVAAARRAFHRNSEWRLMDASKRGEILRKFSDLVERDLDYLAELESYNNGMVLKYSKVFVGGAINIARHLAGCTDKITGQTIPADGEVFSYTLRQPVGVCAIILPWNGPIYLFISKVCTALAAALALAALFAEAGLPKGVVNIINGFGPGAGTSLTHHSDVAKVSFTGSVESGIYDKFVEAAVEHAKGIKVGNPTDPDTENGPQRAFRDPRGDLPATVTINTYLQLTPQNPFGGFKESGIGRENVFFDDDDDDKALALSKEVSDSY